MERWSSPFGFLLAAIGAAVGLGKMWRFSWVGPAVLTVVIASAMGVSYSSEWYRFYID